MESTSILFISHNLSVVVEICDNILIMYGGKMMEYANTQTIIKNPLHPYSKGLVNSFPRIEEKKISFESIPGSPPDMMCPPKGCIFHPRCKNAKQICREETPEIVDVCSNHFVACHLIK
jgi:peptide/nickel transport system ATP-binding protein